jgi:hypothetical protein
MKKIILNIAILFSFTVFFSACEKEETKAVFDDTKAVVPTLKMSVASIKLDAAKAADEAISFDVTKAEYGVATPVNYSVVLTMPDAPNGDKFEKVMSLPAGKFNKKLTVNELNDVFVSEFSKEAGKQYKASIQAIANFGTTFPLKSPIQELTVNTF